MKRHMMWTNIVTGPEELKTVPELRTEEILGMLQKYAKPETRRGTAKSKAN